MYRGEGCVKPYCCRSCYRYGVLAICYHVDLYIRVCVAIKSVLVIILTNIHSLINSLLISKTAVLSYKLNVSLGGPVY